MTSSLGLRAGSRFIISLAVLIASLSGITACGDSGSSKKKTDAGTSPGDGDKGGGGDGDKGSTGDGDQTGKDAGHPVGDGDQGGDGDKGGDGDSLPPGMGINETGIGCLTDQGAAGFYFGTQKKCVLSRKKDGSAFTDQEKMTVATFCTFYNSSQDTPSKVVDACPAEGRLAYCVADAQVGGVPNQVSVTQTAIIYTSAVNADTETLAQNPLGTCQPAYEAASNKAIAVAKCSGTLTAKVDGVMQTFTKNLLCQVKRDDTHLVFTINGSNEANTQTLSLYVLKTGDTIELKNELGTIGYGYLDANTVFSVALTDSPAMFNVANLDAKGAAIKATFAFGLGKAKDSTGADARVFSEGSVDLTFE